MKELISIQQNLVATKSRKGMSYQYRTAEDILAAYKVLPEAKECLLVTTTKGVTMGGGGENREVHFIVVTATLTTPDGKSVSAEGWAEIQMDKLGSMSRPQITGACESYAKKRALGNLFLIEDATSDPDSQVNINLDIKSIKNALNESAHYNDLIAVANMYWNYIQNDRGLMKVYNQKYAALKIAHPEEFPKEG